MPPPPTTTAPSSSKPKKGDKKKHGPKKPGEAKNTKPLPSPSMSTIPAAHPTLFDIVLAAGTASPHVSSSNPDVTKKNAPATEETNITKSGEDGGGGDEDAKSLLSYSGSSDSLEEHGRRMSQMNMDSGLDVRNLIAGKGKVDINRLVYNPRPPQEVTQYDKPIKRVIDYIFLMVNMISFVMTIFYVTLGLSILTFTSSMKSLQGDGLPLENPQTLDKIENDNGTVTVFRLSEKRFFTLNQYSVYLLVTAFLEMLNVLFGVFGCVLGHKNFLILHAVADLLFMILSLVGLLLLRDGVTCNNPDIEVITIKLFAYIRRYGVELPLLDEDRKFELETATYQLNAVQLGLQCCGAVGWSDYINPVILKNANASMPLPKMLDLERVPTVFPASCCRPWWVRNVHCAKGVHLWARPNALPHETLMFRERINQVGCIQQIKNGCENLKGMVQSGLLYYLILSIFIDIIQDVCIFFITKQIFQIIRLKKESIANDTDTKELDDNEENYMIQSGGIPLPTEDETETIKARSDFNRFEAKVKRTIIGKWLRLSRKTVTLEGTSLTKDDQTIMEIMRSTAPTAAIPREDEGDTAATLEEVLKQEIQKHISKRKEKEQKRRERQEKEQKRRAREKAKREREKQAKLAKRKKQLGSVMPSQSTSTIL